MNLAATSVVAAERDLIQHGKVFAPARVVPLKTELLTIGHAFLPVSVGPDHTGVHREALAADDTLGHAAPDGGLEQPAQQITVAEAAMPALAERRVVRHGSVRPSRQNQR